MRIGVVGCGKLGLPVALAIESKGHEVKGYDINPAVKQYLIEGKIPFKEAGLQPLLDATKMEMVSNIASLVDWADIIFLPVQTPHSPDYEGVTCLPSTREDFDYGYLKEAVISVSGAANSLGKKTVLAVISTCLPGTYEREIKPLLSQYVSYVYTPQFIAMGTVLQDYLYPEFNLIGVEDPEAAEALAQFYTTINDAPHVSTDITTAEGIKVSYNTWITAKTVIANTWGELCHKLGMNFDDMFSAWSLSNKRLISTRYMNSGVGDGGGCHPRDNIALSWLAQEVELSYDIFESLMLSRENHMGFIGSEALKLSQENELPIIIIGKSFKPETNIETGSPSRLMAHILSDANVSYSHYEDMGVLPQAVYVIGTKHQKYLDYEFPEGSIVLDPFRYIPEREGVRIISIGRNNERRSNR